MRILILSVILSLATWARAQEIQQSEGVDYFLPKTALRIALKIEKKTYTPGEYAEYAGRYLKRGDVSTIPDVAYTLLNIQLTSVGIPDSAKMFTAKMNAGHSINHVDLNGKGVLLAVNMNGQDEADPPAFVPSPKPVALNPHDFMNADILAAGSKPKMAELVAQEIIEIRESRNQLTRGQADFMPKDGEQLKIMLQKLDVQEKALSQLFLGMEEKDTTEIVFQFVPTEETEKQLLFRFSEKLGLTDLDDLGGRPYYIRVRDEHSVPTLRISLENKKEKDDPGIRVTLPGKVTVTIYSDEEERASFQLYAAQFGKLIQLPGYFFSKKMRTQIRLNPTTGYPESFNSEYIK